MENDLFVCLCGDINHQLVVTTIEEEDGNIDAIYFEIHLSDVGLWNRIRYAFSYILGKKSKYNSGAFGEILLDKEKTQKLINVLQNNLRKMK